MSNLNNYPVFEADQVLKSDHLNGMFNYLDEQNRLTRSYLIGIGIVCGLESNHTPAAIEISPGLGVTSLGYLMQFDGGSYTHARSYQLPDDVLSDTDSNNFQLDVRSFYGGFSMWQLFAPTAENPLTASDTALDNTLFLADKVVALFLELTVNNLKNCTTNDCDDKGSSGQFIVRPMLMQERDLAQFKYAGFETNKEALPDIVLKRFNVPFKELKSSSEILDAFYSITDSATLKNISEAYSNTYNTFKAVLSPEPEDPFKNMLNVLNNQLSDVKDNKTVFTEYYYDYIDDLVKAYNEFRETGDALLVECRPDESLFPYHLALCEALNDSRNTVSAYRNYFIHSPVFGEQKKRASALQSLFGRMKLMLSAFAAPDPKLAEKIAVKITPSKFGDIALSQRAIPYYYDVPALLSYWNYDKTRRGKASKNLSYYSASADDAVINPLKYELESYNFFRIEGHAGKHINSALPMVLQLKQSMNLPFDVIALNTVASDSNIDATDLKCHFSDLESLYNVLTAELMCKLHEPVCLISKLPYYNFIKPIIDFNGGLIFDSGLSNTFLRTTTAKTTDTLSRSSTFELSNELQNINQFSQLSTVQINTATTSLIDAAKLMEPYKKGTFLQHFCSPVAYDEKTKSAGQVYLEIVAKSQSGLPKPVSSLPGTGSDTITWINYINQHLLYFIDVAETLLTTILPLTLSEFNFSNFSKYYAILKEEAAAFAAMRQAFIVYALSLRTDDKQTPNEAEANILLAGLSPIDTNSLTRLCMDERLEALVNEYNKRVNTINLEKLFSAYTSQHSGIEHKAGVPKGGTFIMVYEERSITPVETPGLGSIKLADNIKNIGLEKSTVLASASFGKETESKEQQPTSIDFSSFLESNKLFLSESDFVLAKSLFGRIPGFSTNPGATNFNIGPGIVFADFYLPYMCCSDCAPISYIVPQPELPASELPTISLDRKAVCSNDVNTPVTITVNPAGGDLSVRLSNGANAALDKVTKVNETTYTFLPANIPTGAIEIVYTLNNQSASDGIALNTAPNADFTFSLSPLALRIMQFKSDGSATGMFHSWNFGDPLSATANTTTEENPVHNFSANASSGVFNVTHIVTSPEKCVSQVTKQVPLAPQPETVNDSKVFCFDKMLPLEPSGNFTGSEIINKEELKPIMEKNGFSINEKMQIIFAGELVETIKFSVRYKITTGTSSVEKTTTVTIISVNTHFTIRADNANKVVLFLTQAKLPEGAEWKIVINNVQPVVGNGKEFKVLQQTFGNLEMMNVELVVTEIENGVSCKKSRVSELITRTQYLKMISANGEINF